MDTFKKILDDVDEVDLTMIDVTFFLLIYFMVTTMINNSARTFQYYREICSK